MEKFVQLNISEECFELTIESLRAFRSTILKLNKLPVKKANKLQGYKLSCDLDSLIKQLEKGRY